MMVTQWKHCVVIRSAAGEKSDGATLQGTFIQDWTAPTGTSAILYLLEHDLEEVDYTYTPNPDGAYLQWKGTYQAACQSSWVVMWRHASPVTLNGRALRWPPVQTPPVVAAAGARLRSSAETASV